MLHLAALIATLLVAALHVVFMVLETFLWTTRTGRRIFAQSAEDAVKTKLLAQNQGVYNGALAATLAWAALSGQGPATIALLVFVVVVGVYGAITVKPTIFVVQALPAIAALVLHVLA